MTKTRLSFIVLGCLLIVWAFTGSILAALAITGFGCCVFALVG